MPPKFRHNNRKGLLWTPPVPARFRRRNRGIAPSSTSSGPSTQQTQSLESGGASDGYDDYSIDPIVCESVLRRDGGKCVLCGIDDSMEDNRLETILVAWNNQAVGSHTAMVRFQNNWRERLFFWSIGLPFSGEDVDLEIRHVLCLRLDLTPFCRRIGYIIRVLYQSTSSPPTA